MKGILSFVFILLLNTTIAQTYIPAGLVSGTWTSANSPYYIQGEIIVANGTTLTIDPGVRVEFQGSFRFLIEGQLLAVGNATDSITFTATNTTAGWLGIRFDSTLVTNDTSRFSYCVFQFGKANGTLQTDNGGALYFNHFSKVVVLNSKITKCSASLKGGAIYGSESSPIISKNIFLSNTTPGDGGAGIYFLNSQAQILGNTFIGNRTTGSFSKGGAINCYDCTGAVIDSNTFQNNSSSYGASIYSMYGSPDIIHNTISNDTSAQGIVFLVLSNATVSHNTITNNTGIAIHVESLSPEISYNIISHNMAGIACFGVSGINSPDISFNIIDHNNANGIFCYISTPVISYNFITNNTGDNGGGIKCTDSPTPIYISNNVIANNASISGGGAVYCNNSSPELINNTITNNYTFSNGGALYCTAASSPHISNSILWGNSANFLGDQIYLFDDASDPDIRYNDIEGGYTAFGLNTNVTYMGFYINNLDWDPYFVLPSAGSGTSYDGLNADWFLLATSPCIDGGDPSGIYPAADIAGNARVSNNRIDQGAYETLFTSSSEMETVEGINIFPSPANGKFTVEVPYSSGQSQVDIYSSYGQHMIKEVLNKASLDIDIHTLLPGIYLVSVTDQDGKLRYSSRFIKD